MKVEVDIQDIDKWIRQEKGLFIQEIEIKLDAFTIARFVRKTNDGDDFEFKGFSKKGVSE